MESLTGSRILITGGNGFVGRSILEEMRSFDNRNEIEVFSMDRTESHRWSGVDTSVIADIRDRNRVDAVVRRISPDYCIHLAAVHYIPYCSRHPEETFAVNVLGTQNLLLALQNTMCKRIFLASTAGVYTPSLTPHKETDPAWPVDIYGFTKRAAEMLAWEWVTRNADVELVIGRYFNMYGPGETTPHLIPEIINQAKVGNEIRLGNVGTRRDYVHVSDNAYATVQSLTVPILGEQPIRVVVNMGSGSSYDALDLIHMVSVAKGSTLTHSPDPARMRKSDRPVLVADTARYQMMWLRPPKVSLFEGLRQLYHIGVGPDIQWGIR